MKGNRIASPCLRRPPFLLRKRKGGKRNRSLKPHPKTLRVSTTLRGAGTAQIAPLPARKLLPCVPWRGNRVQCWTEPCAVRDGSGEVRMRSEWDIWLADLGHKELQDSNSYPRFSVNNYTIKAPEGDSRAFIVSRHTCLEYGFTSRSRNPVPEGLLPLFASRSPGRP